VGGSSANPGAANAELFDPATGTFNPSSLSPSRGYPLALFVGGQPGAEIYDPAAGFFAVTGPPQVSGEWSYPAAATLANGRVLVVGGHVGAYSWANPSLLANAILFDPATNSFALSGSLIWPRAQATATRLLDGRVLIFGGEGEASWPDRGELFDPSTGTFGATVSTGAGRTGHTATLLPSGKVLIAGGESGTSIVSRSGPAASLLFEPF